MANYRPVAELVTEVAEAKQLPGLIRDVLETWSRPVSNVTAHSNGIAESFAALRDASAAFSSPGQGAKFAFHRFAPELPMTPERTRQLAYTNASMLDRSLGVAHGLAQDLSVLTQNNPNVTGFTIKLVNELGGLNQVSKEHLVLSTPSGGINSQTLKLDKESIMEHSNAIARYLDGLERAAIGAAPPEALPGLGLAASTKAAVGNRALSELERTQFAALKAAMLDENVRISHALAQDSMRYAQELIANGHEVPGLFAKSQELAAKLGAIRDSSGQASDLFLRHPSLQYRT